MPAKNLSVNSVDFDVVRQNIKTYLSNSDTFTDYDFEGSAMSTLIDTLAYDFKEVKEEFDSFRMRVDSMSSAVADLVIAILTDES